MTASVRERRPERAAAAPRGGGAPARRAIIRWAWRLFRREWRQQLLILALLAVAVMVTTIASAFASSFPGSPVEATFGTANHLVTIPGTDAHLAADLAAIASRFGSVDVIENQTITIPGSVAPLDLRAQNPSGRFGGPMLALVAGRYPTGPAEVALTSQAAGLLGLHLGQTWRPGGTGNGRVRQIVGLVENPQNLSDQFALVAPSQISAPTQVTVLFDASAARVAGAKFPDGAAPTALPPPANGVSLGVGLVLVLDTLGLLLIGLVCVAGFMVMAQRRLRALGMLGAVGATDRNIRLVLVANGAVVGVIASVIGALAGIAGWAAAAPRLQRAAGHRIDSLALPWLAIGGAVVLAVLTAIAAAWWPSRSVARTPVVAALAGRPASPRPARRLALVGVGLLAGGLVSLAFSDQNGGVALLVAVGVLATGLGLAFIGPPMIEALAAAGRGAPIAIRLALRDLARYQARSGAALAACSLAAGIAAAVVLALTQAAAQAAQTTPAEPSLPANQLIVYVSPTGANEITRVLTRAQLHSLDRRIAGLAASLHAAAPLALDAAVRRDTASQVPSADGFTHGFATAGLVKMVPTCPAPGAEYAGSVYVATRALLSFYGIRPGSVGSATELLTSRTDLAGLQVASGATGGCGYSTGIRYLTHPKIQTVGLPADTSDPNTLITAKGLGLLGLRPVQVGWLIQAPRPLTTDQLRTARLAAVAAGVSVETRSTHPSLAEIRYWITTAGVLLALAVLAMTVGLIRSETAPDLSTLTATGASSRTRRTLTATTAGALGLLGALIGIAVAYLAIIAWHRSHLATLATVPLADLLIIAAGLPLIAFAGGWLLAGREPPSITRQVLR